MKSSVYDELEWRGLNYQSSDPELGSVLAGKSMTAYCGFDASAPSLHNGHLLQMIRLRRLQQFGHKTIALAGGGTGLIGDPTDVERPLLTKEEVEANVEQLRPQIERLLDLSSGKHSAVLLNNADWLTKLGLTDFLRDIGKHFSVNSMVAKDSVRIRLESREQGISYAEFSYMLLQAYDFLWLFDNHGCRLQLGASDQWGNIIEGVELIRRLRGTKAYGLTSPLILDAEGRKLSKSAGVSVWLDPKRTSPYEFYQHWINTEDSNVVTFLKYYTFLSREEIESLEEQVKRDPSRRDAQRVLAEELTRMLHGEDELRRAQEASRALFSGEVHLLDEPMLLEVFKDAPSSEVSTEELNAGVSLTDLLVRTGLSKSKAEARTHIGGGGVTVNSERVDDTDATLTKEQLMFGKYLLLRRGKKTYHLVRCG